MATTPDIVKVWNLYVDGSKIGTGTSTEISNDAPGELQITADGVIARAQGVATSKVTLNTVTTFGGKANTQKLLLALLNNTPLKLTAGVIDGKIEEYYPMWCHSRKLSGDFASGKATGSYDFEGVAPTLTG
jgi:hypothetical protein